MTRAGHPSVVIVSIEDFESMRETAYLMRSPTNARRLFDAMERLESGAGEEHSLMLLWDLNAWEDYLWWQTQDREVLKRVNLLIADVLRQGNEGSGKPEPLKRDVAGYWSRRITDEHRLVYKITETEVRIAACSYHYGR